tara:strand:- start:408 stop:611 length:204 start_codon:yes stop_codon:yes gene_type:complete
MVFSLTVKQLRRRGNRFGCPTNSFLYSFVMGGAVKAGAGVGSVFLTRHDRKSNWFKARQDHLGTFEL